MLVAGSGLFLFSTIPAGREPALPVLTLNGSDLNDVPISSSAYAGSPLVVNFWASWCATCYEEQPGINEAVNRFAARGVRFVGIDMRDDRAAAAAFVAQFDVRYPSVFDPANEVGLRYGITAPPSWLFVDRRGTVFRRVAGGLHQGDLFVTIDQLLATGG